MTEEARESSMIEADEYPVRGDQIAVAALYEHAHILDTAALTERALSLGIHPPDERPGWFIVLEYSEDGSERGLFWADPDDE